MFWSHLSDSTCRKKAKIIKTSNKKSKCSQTINLLTKLVPYPPQLVNPEASSPNTIKTSNSATNTQTN